MRRRAGDARELQKNGLGGGKVGCRKAEEPGWAIKKNIEFFAT